MGNGQRVQKDNGALLMAHCTLLIALLAVSSTQAAPWSGVINSPRATDWTTAGIPGGIPSGSWTQCGATIAAYGSSGSYASPTTIQNAINACGTNQYVLLGPGDFYLNSGFSLKSNMVLRGSGANQTRLHMSGASGCNGLGAAACIVGSNTYSGYCLSQGVNMWSCPPGGYTSGYQNSANWTGSYAQGANTITLDNVSGLVPNVTPIVIDQCDTGFAGSPGSEGCNTGSGGIITAASVYPNGGGSGYNVGDTGTINCTSDFGRCYGSGTAAYTVTSVDGGAVTGFTLTYGGSGYTYTNMNQYFGSPTLTTATGGTGAGFEVQITGITPYDNGGIMMDGVAMISNYLSDAGTSRPARSQVEVAVPTSVSGNTVTLNHPLMHPNWASGQSPQAWWGSSTITNAGIEDLMIDLSATSTSCVTIQTASRVWVKGLACSTANVFHVMAAVASNFEVRDSYFYWTKNAGTTSYGIGSAGEVGNALFENNILQGITDPMVPDGACSGCVFAYNFSVNDYDTAITYEFASSPMHGAGTDYILEEGNIGAGVQQDVTHGPHFFNTFFRNYFTGYESNNGAMPLYTTIPVIVNAPSRYNNYLGNVLGTPGYHAYYQCVAVSTGPSSCPTYNVGYGPWSFHIWDLGYSGASQSDFSNSPATPNDPLTVSSLLRYGNYDVVNGGVQSNPAEVPTSDPHFPNSIPSGVFPASFYNGSIAASSNCGTGLSYWKNPTTGTCPPYPNVGPDVHGGDIGMCTSGTYKWSRALNSGQCAGGSFTASVNGGYGNSNPAMRCYLNQMAGPPDGTGNILSFNRAACYANDAAGGSSGATPPTVATPASANPNPVTGTTTNLSVLGSDVTGESNLTYTWSPVGTLPASVAFSTNSTNATKNTTATFTQAGSYGFQVVMIDTSSLTAMSSTTVTVDQTVSSITVSPLTATVQVNGTHPFTAKAFDQFNQPMAVQPSFTWSVPAQAGTINASGLFTAGVTAGGPFNVTATAKGVSSLAAQVIVTAAAPPTVTLTSPTDGATFTAPAAIALAATVTPGTNPISQVQFLQGVTVLQTYNNPTTTSFSFTWTNVAAGTYPISAVVTDSQDLPNTSNIAHITVNTAVLPPPPPSGPMTLPAINPNDLPSSVGINDSLSITNYPDSNVSFVWSFGPLTPNNSNVSSLVITRGAGTASFSSGVKTASLASYGLVPGIYQVTVQAQDARGDTSPPLTATITLVNADLSAVKVYPNPWRSDKHAGKSVTFSGLTTGTTIKIFSVSGHEVRELNTDGPSTTWDLTNDSGDKVGSGIYLYVITDGQGDRVRGKVAVIK